MNRFVDFGRSGACMRKTGLLALTLSAMCPNSAVADVGARVDAGVSYTDNIRRVAIDETEEHIGVAGVELSWLEDSRRIEADVTVDGSFLHYRNDTYEDE